MRCQSVLSHQDETAARGVFRGVTLGGGSLGRVLVLNYAIEGGKTASHK